VVIEPQVLIERLPALESRPRRHRARMTECQHLVHAASIGALLCAAPHQWRSDRIRFLRQQSLALHEVEEGEPRRAAI
tara:strand:- start:229 stop:462 length:234 start_codon:yes stop_codon:yes gene_type:complete